MDDFRLPIAGGFIFAMGWNCDFAGCFTTTDTRDFLSVVPLVSFVVKSESRYSDGRW